MIFRLLLVLLLISSPSLSFAGAVAYTYDELDRLHTATFEDKYQVTYEYDEIGNLRNRSVQSFLGSGSVSFQYGDGKAYYPSSNGWYTYWTPPSLGFATIVCNGAGGGNGGNNYNGDANGGAGGYSAFGLASTPNNPLLSAAGGFGGVEDFGDGESGDKAVLSNYDLSHVSYIVYVGRGGVAAIGDGNNGAGYNPGLSFGATSLLAGAGGVGGGAGGPGGSGASGSVTINWTPTGTTPPLLTTTTLPTGASGVPYNYTLTATGGTPPYTWSLYNGNLPNGLTLNSAGSISGTPIIAVNANFAILVTDSVGSASAKDFSLSITAPYITNSSFFPGAVGTSYSASLTVNGGVSPYTWSVIAGSLPVGLSLNSLTGVISGIPTTSGISNFTLQVSDSLGSVSTPRAFNISIEAPPPSSSDGFIEGSALRAPWVFYQFGYGASPVATQAIASTAGHISNPAVDVSINGTFTPTVSRQYTLFSEKSRNSFSFWYKMPSVTNSQVYFYWADGTQYFVDDGEGGYWETSIIYGTLITDNMWRQYSQTGYSTKIWISRGISNRSGDVNLHDYFDSFEGF